MWNESELAQIVGTTPRTIGRYVDLFWRLFHVRLLPPFFVNVAKRLRKAPKLYFRDSGLAHALLGIDTLANLQAHPRIGGSWEAFVIEHIIRLLGVPEAICSHYGVHSGAELDLVIQTPAGLLGFEIKFGPPSLTASMRSVLADLKPARLYAIYYGDRDYPLGGQGEPVRAVGITSLPLLAQQLRQEFRLEDM